MELKPLLTAVQKARQSPSLVIGMLILIPALFGFGVAAVGFSDTLLEIGRVIWPILTHPIAPFVYFIIGCILVTFGIWDIMRNDRRIAEEIKAHKENELDVRIADIKEERGKHYDFIKDAAFLLLAQEFVTSVGAFKEETVKRIRDARATLANTNFAEVDNSAHRGDMLVEFFRKLGDPFNFIDSINIKAPFLEGDFPGFDLPISISIKDDEAEDLKQESDANLPVGMQRRYRKTMAQYSEALSKTDQMLKKLEREITDRKVRMRQFGKGDQP